MSPLGKALVRAMSQPDDWDIGKYTAIHVPSRTEWWISNGGFFFGPHKPKEVVELGLIERHLLYWKLCRRVLLPKAKKAKARLSEQLTKGVEGRKN